MDGKIKILFVDDDPVIRNLFSKAIGKEPFQVRTASGGEEALKILKAFPADLVISDVVMPGMDGFELLERIRQEFPETFVVMVTGSGAVSDAVNAIKAGAYDYILKPFDFQAVRSLIRNVAGHKEILDKNRFSGHERRKHYRLENFIGRDPRMFRVFQRIKDVAASSANVLITGETGTGKDLAADAVHYNSPRRSGPMVKVNCAALTETLIGSELFGHEKGAFTGALYRKKGHFELARGGTIFLDEIGDIPVQTQISLLRILENGTFQRVGGMQTLTADARFICATHKDLRREVALGRFREDLFYRINVARIAMPSLRERKADIPLLADHFLKKYSAEAGRNIPRISGPAMHLLCRYDWPGNVRELANIMERAVIFCKGPEIFPSDLADVARRAALKSDFSLTLSSSSLPEAEFTLISKVLEETGWNLKQAAERLAIARGTLYSKMKKYGIRKPE
ncbi:sigma-54-dependent transcriptional regulator [Desulfococcus multivorans]|uniref:Two component, sigma54 specific, transcriptional regulator, Fis family n=1 Tax=Desulfococcus multivorans DSM 2059 TaxID=1121405 RepID=S7V942_DESML|nr:sigma-54 dependent transcriptional regulator [Desulfococcus multivorans]AOY60438.1 two component system response regulator, sigma54-specific [Desulfococcus multivorans]AQV02530.1 sigma-54-dependent Fis family transcriptional regulator [Desulfococcus multivorans]EPR41063.1 two component, sigma54 specific, transcriptional regulator, Fis family [Desulfococcus multivorans DSM 2059]SJZ61583.1 two-component system, NtrC family, response regulator [Desulfococcus multivorans DSM 2059]